MPTRNTSAPPATESPARQLARFIAKFDRDNAKIILGAVRKMRARFPTAIELVYDNYNALAIGWTPNGRTSEVIVSVAGTSRGAVLYFTHGKKLHDPEGLLQGAGNQGRFIRIETLAVLDDPEVESLLQAAVDQGKTPLPETGRGYTVIKSISAKQRPRR
ncbi:MAG: hypothetical protein ABJE47_08470 [bacterium]